MTLRDHRLRVPPLLDCRGGALLKLCAFLAVVGAAATLAWMLFLPLVVTHEIRQRTGFDATVESLAVNPFTGTIEVRGLVVTNPPTFPIHEFIELRHFAADVEMLSLFTDRPVIASATLDLARVTLVKREAGHTNAGAFHEHLTDPGAATPRPPSARAGRGLLIRALSVRLDELMIADHSGAVPVVQDFKLGFRHDFTNVTDTRQLLAPAALQSLLPAGPLLRELVPGRLGDAIGDAVKDAAKTGARLLEHAGHRVEEKTKGYFDALEESKKP